jgi:plastocyanin
MRLLALALLASTLVLPASALGGSPTAQPSATADVQVGDFFFRPDYTRIEPGDSVTWTVLEGSPHTATSLAGAPVPFDSGDLLPGQRFSFTFATAGRYPYVCAIHPFMRGTVQVGPDTTDPRITRTRAKPGKRSVRISFRLSETSRVSATLASARRPGRVLRRLRARKVRSGGRALSIRTAGLAPGRYRVTLKAKDPEGNVGRAKVAFRLGG